MAASHREPDISGSPPQGSLNTTGVYPVAVSRKIRKSDKSFTAEQVLAMERAATRARDRAYFLYHVETGLRVSDVLGTRLEHVDWKQYRTWTFDFKKDKWRWIYWPARVAPALKMWLKERLVTRDQETREQAQLLFPFSEKTANRIIKLLAAKIDYPLGDLASAHFCRHTFIRLSRRAGRDIKAVQQNTGDTVKTILEWYSELSGDDMRREMEDKPIY